MIEITMKTKNGTFYALATRCQEKKAWLCSVTNQDCQIVDTNFYPSDDSEVDGFMCLTAMLATCLAKENATQH